MAQVGNTINVPGRSGSYTGTAMYVRYYSQDSTGQLGRRIGTALVNGATVDVYVQWTGYFSTSGYSFADLANAPGPNDYQLLLRGSTWIGTAAMRTANYDPFTPSTFAVQPPPPPPPEPPPAPPAPEPEPEPEKKSGPDLPISGVNRSVSTQPIVVSPEPFSVFPKRTYSPRRRWRRVPQVQKSVSGPMPLPIGLITAGLGAVSSIAGAIGRGRSRPSAPSPPGFGGYSPGQAGFTPNQGGMIGGIPVNSARLPTGAGLGTLGRGLANAFRGGAGRVPYGSLPTQRNLPAVLQGAGYGILGGLAGERVVQGVGGNRQASGGIDPVMLLLMGKGGKQSSAIAAALATGAPIQGPPSQRMTYRADPGYVLIRRRVNGQEQVFQMLEPIASALGLYKHPKKPLLSVKETRALEDHAHAEKKLAAAVRKAGYATAKRGTVRHRRMTGHHSEHHTHHTHRRRR